MITTSSIAASIAVNPRRISLLHADRDQSATAPLELHARKRTRGRALQDAAVRHGEIAFMAGALEAVVLRGIVDRARQVRAFLAEGGESAGARMNQDAVSVRCRISEEFNAARGQFVRAGDLLLGVSRHLTKPGADQNPEIAGEHTQAC